MHILDILESELEKSSPAEKMYLSMILVEDIKARGSQNNVVLPSEIGLLEPMGLVEVAAKMGLKYEVVINLLRLLKRWLSLKT